MDEMNVEQVNQSVETEINSTTAEVETATETPTEEKSTETVSTDDTVTLRYNKEDVKVSKDEVKRLAQYGMHLEKIGAGSGNDFKEMLSELDYYATLQGKSIKDAVKALIDGAETSYKEELIEQLGEGNPLIEEMLELRRNKNRKVYEDAKAEREKKTQTDAAEKERSIAAKISAQFEEIVKEFPEYPTIEDIPEKVLKNAFKSGDLEKELFRYKLTEEKKVNAAKQQEEKNKEQNIGSAHSTSAENDILSAIMKGIRG